MSRDRLINILIITLAAATTLTLRASTQPPLPETASAPTVLDWQRPAAELEQTSAQLAALDASNSFSTQALGLGAVLWKEAPRASANATTSRPQGSSSIASGLPPRRQTARSARAPKLDDRAETDPADDFQSRMERYAAVVEQTATRGQLPPPRWSYIRLNDLVPLGRIELGGQPRLWVEIRDEQSVGSIAVGTQLLDAQLVDVARSTATFRLSNGELRTLRFAQQRTRLRPLNSGNDGAQRAPVEPQKITPPTTPQPTAHAAPLEGALDQSTQFTRPTAPTSTSSETNSNADPAVGSDAGSAKPANTSPCQGCSPEQPAPTESRRPISRHLPNNNTKLYSQWASPTSISELFSASSKGFGMTEIASIAAPGSFVKRHYNHVPRPVRLLHRPIDETQIHSLAHLYSAASYEMMADGAVSSLSNASYNILAQTTPKIETEEKIKEKTEEKTEESGSHNHPHTQSAQASFDQNLFDVAAKTQTPSENADAPKTPTQFENVAEKSNSTSPSGQMSQAKAPLQSSSADEKTSANNLGDVSHARERICDPTAHGALLTIDGLTRPIALQALVEQLNQTFGANIVLEPEIQDLPVRVSVRDLPWMDLIRTIAEWNDLTIDCDPYMVRIMRRGRRQQIDQARRQQEPLIRKVFKLKYVQPSQNVRVNLAGQPADGGAGATPTVASLEESIRAILRAGDGRGDVRRVPGRNELIVAATAAQMREIEELIARVDRPTYQIVIRTLVYTVNENRLRDVGLQVDGIITGRAGRTVGGLATQSNLNVKGNTGNTGNGTGGGTGGSGNNANSQQVGLTPGGLPNLGPFNRVTSPLGAAQPNSIAFFSSIVGTAQLDAALTLAEQRGAARVESRPFCVVSEGETCNTVNGTTIPVVTTAIAGGATVGIGQPSFIEASRVLAVTPQVAEDETGRPAFVTLAVRLENNTVDTSLPLFNGLPGINRQSLQTILRLRPGETAVIGGLANDQFSRALAQVPGLGSIPIIGRLFQRRLNQTTRNRLYFALTAEVVTQNQSLPNPAAPLKLSTELPPTPTVK